MPRRVPKTEINFLRQVPIFSQCTIKELRTVAALGTTLDIPAGRVLTEQGKPGLEFYLISAGEASCSVNGRKRTNLGPGDFFGELSLLVSGPRTATVTAVTPMKVTVLHAGEFSDLVRSSPAIIRKVMTSLARRIRAADRDNDLTH